MPSASDAKTNQLADPVPPPGFPGAGGNHYRSLTEVLNELARYRKERGREPRVAFAIAGGGATGAYEAGVIDAYYRAVSKRPEAEQPWMKPALIIGTSAGALNAVTMLLDALKIGHPSIIRTGGETFGVAVWRVIGGANQGARFVVGARKWLVGLVTRWIKSPLAKRFATTVLPAVGLLLLNPVLFAWFFRNTEQQWIKQVCEWINERATGATLITTGVFAALLATIAVTFWRAAFANSALSSTIANAVMPEGAVARKTGTAQLLRSRSASELREASKRVVAVWEAARRDPSTPEFMVTATDLTAERDALFTLVRPETFQRLARQKWAVFQIGGTALGLEVEGQADFLADNGGTSGATDAEELVRCVVASTSIPGVFPSQRIPLRSFRGGGKTVLHDFVDGGVLNNAPVHVAIDAGATHVLSLELNELYGRDPLDIEASGGEPPLPGNVIGSFMTMLDNATSEDLRKATSVNRQLARSRQGAAVDGPDAKKIVTLYRVAPAVRKVGTVEFNGHFDSVLSGPSVGLVDWMNEGKASAENGHVFWDATLVAAPAAGVEPPDTCELCPGGAAGGVAAGAGQGQPGAPPPPAEREVRQ